MPGRTELPHILAVINVLTVATLMWAFLQVKQGAVARHRAAMLFAAVLGAAFLALYLTYHFGSGLAKFGGVGVIRPIYFSILIVHIIMAGLSAVLVPFAYYAALTDRIQRHRRLVTWAWPVWMFVAVSGLVVYVMTIHLYPYHGV